MSRQKDTREGFLLSIAEDRFNRDLRLIFADFLEDQGLDDEAAFQRKWTPKLQRAIDWIEGFSSAHELDYEEVIETGRRYANSGEYEIDWTSDTANEEFESDPSMLEMFWKYWSDITGQSHPNGPEVEREYYDDGCYGC